MNAADEVLGKLADGAIVIIDGGTGTQLQSEGAAMDDQAWSALASLRQPEVVQRVHESYLRAGAEVLIANTFAAGRAALEPAGLGDRVADANRAAVRAAQQARDAAATRPVAIAGSMSSFCPIAMTGRGEDGAPPLGKAADDPRFPDLAAFREQAALLAGAGVDLIALELIENAGYGRAAVQAAAETGLPVWLGLSALRGEDGGVITDPDMGDGDSFEDLVASLASPSLTAVTVMHSKPDVVPDALAIIRRHYAGPLGVYAESGSWAAPNWVFDGMTPQEYLDAAAGWVEHGAQLIGGCCGVGPEHIEALASQLTRPPRGARQEN
ncbi:MAG TPA: homocysteine S-methyltransferase family protein [Streptosporangiaceae bacterium]|jgi:homocysteine S-methyltransferase